MIKQWSFIGSKKGITFKGSPPVRSRAIRKWEEQQKIKTS